MARASRTPWRLQYDLYYVKNRSMALDFYIVFETLKTVMTRSGS